MRARNTSPSNNLKSRSTTPNKVRHEIPKKLTGPVEHADKDTNDGFMSQLKSFFGKKKYRYIANDSEYVSQAEETRKIINREFVLIPKQELFSQSHVGKLVHSLLPHHTEEDLLLISSDDKTAKKIKITFVEDQIVKVGWDFSVYELEILRSNLDVLYMFVKEILAVKKLRKSIRSIQDLFDVYLENHRKANLTFSSCNLGFLFDICNYKSNPQKIEKMYDIEASVWLKPDLFMISIPYCDRIEVIVEDEASMITGQNITRPTHGDVRITNAVDVKFDKFNSRQRFRMFHQGNRYGILKSRVGKKTADDKKNENSALTSHMLEYLICPSFKDYLEFQHFLDQPEPWLNQKRILYCYVIGGYNVNLSTFLSIQPHLRLGHLLNMLMGKFALHYEFKESSNNYESYLNYKTLEVVPKKKYDPRLLDSIESDTFVSIEKLFFTNNKLFCELIKADGNLGSDIWINMVEDGREKNIVVYFGAIREWYAAKYGAEFKDFDVKHKLDEQGSIIDSYKDQMSEYKMKLHEKRRNHRKLLHVSDLINYSSDDDEDKSEQDHDIDHEIWSGRNMQVEDKLGKMLYFYSSNWAVKQFRFTTFKKL